MMLAGAVGDFTRGLVSDPPRHLWVRGVHFAGLPYLVHMYNRAVLVATGSGIAVEGRSPGVSVGFGKLELLGGGVSCQRIGDFQQMNGVPWFHEDLSCQPR